MPGIRWHSGKRNSTLFKFTVITTEKVLDSLM
jgi:hypothetical protein